MEQLTTVEYRFMINYGVHPISGNSGPFVLVSLRGPNRMPVDVIAMIDSGATKTGLPATLARSLGINLTEGNQDTYRIGGVENPAYIHHIDIEFNGIVERCKVWFVESGLGQNLLGREDFFEKFQIGFNERLSEIYLLRY